MLPFQDSDLQKSLIDYCKKLQLLEWTFDWNYMVRGLVLDKKRGNILKVNENHILD